MMLHSPIGCCYRVAILTCCSPAFKAAFLLNQKSPKLLETCTICEMQALQYPSSKGVYRYAAADTTTKYTSTCRYNSRFLNCLHMPQNDLSVLFSWKRQSITNQRQS